MGKMKDLSLMEAPYAPSTADAEEVIVAPLADLAVALPIGGFVDPFRRSGGEWYVTV